MEKFNWLNIYSEQDFLQIYTACAGERKKKTLQTHLI